jgi:gluconokinase
MGLGSCDFILLIFPFHLFLLMMAIVPSAETFSKDESVVLALDVGTSSVRASLYTEEAREIPGTQARAATNISTTVDGGAELDAEEAVKQVSSVIDAALSLASGRAAEIETVAVSCFWHSLVGVDDEGRAVTPVLGWADTRAAREAEELRGSFDERVTHARTGAPFHPSYWPAKLLWLKRDAETCGRVVSWMSFGEFLSLKLFGKARASVSMASGTGLFDIHRCVWDEELCGALQVSSKQLPEIAGAREAFNELREEYARRWPRLSRARWFPAVGDGAANNIGAGCVAKERVALMIGTSGAMRVLFEGEPPASLPRGLWCYRADRRRVVVGGALSDGGGLWAWMNETLRLSAKVTEDELAALEPDSHGLTVLPFWAGERSTGWHGRARGAIIGLSMHTRPVEILRAALEAVAYRFAHITEALDRVAPGASIVASGGALHASSVWAQIIADVTARPLTISGAEESSSRGAVLLALEASDKIKSISQESAPAERVIEPDMTSHALYQRGRERQQQLYERLIETT